MQRRSFLSLLAIAGASTLAACSVDSDAAQSAVAVGGTFEFHSPGGETEIRYPEEERQPIPSFDGPDLMDESATIGLADFAGQIVVLNAWGQWCAPCRAEVDDLQITHEELQANGNGTVLGINVRDFQRQAAKDFVTDNGVSYPSIYDPPFRTAAALGGVPSSVIPTTVILDRQHRPAAVFLREVTSDDILAVTRELEQEA